MRRVNNILKALILAIILILVSLVCIVTSGKTYTIRLKNVNNVTSIDDINIEIDGGEEIVKCIDKSLKNETLTIKLESVSKGKTFVAISSNDGNYNSLFLIYVHEFGIITFNKYLGKSTNSIIFSIAIEIWIAYILYLLINTYRENLKKNMYQYKNIAYLGIIIFLSFAFINQMLSLFNYNDLIYTVEWILTLVSSFTVIILPIAFIVSILVVISNIVLVKNEGLNIRNFLGLILGVFLCFSTIFPEILYRMIYLTPWFDIHNEQGIAMYVHMLVEKTIYICVTYLECVLLGTIILGIKSARHIPQFDKDFILILGCQIKKDGTLTNLLKGRVDRAIEFSNMQKEKSGKDLVFVPSGGQGKDEVISEAKAMKNYLLEKGIKEENILVEDKSKNTFENIKFSNRIIEEKKKDANIAFSTTNYHVFRAGALANLQGINMEGIGAKTKSYFWINAFIREFVATLFSEKKKHILILSSIVIIAIFMIMLLYISNII